MNHLYADTILTHGNFITMNLRAPFASAMAIAEGKILHMGTWEEVKNFRHSSTEIINLQEKTVIPGFCESHGHLLGIGRMGQQLALNGLTSLEQILDLIKKSLSLMIPGQWILGRGWDQNLWKPPVFPTHSPLTFISPLHPVCLTRIDGHAYWVNLKALELAQINSSTPDPIGGKIVKDSQGRPTGILIDKAMDLIDHVIPPRSREMEREALKIGIETCLQHGITHFHDACSPRTSMELYKEFLSQDQLKLKTYVMIDGNDPQLLQEILEEGPQNFDQGRLNISAVKLYSDGALGSCGAALHQEYDCQKGNCGLLLLNEEDIEHITSKALSRSIQVCTHAIGDKANTMVLNAYEKALQKSVVGPVRQGRLRVEHAQILLPEDVPRFARHGIIASMQATHCTSDMAWIEDRLGKKRARERASVWRALLDSGAVIANGSDAPIESINPLLGFYASITRKNTQGFPEEGWNCQQKMTRWEALRSWTLHGAYAAFAENTTGSLEKGKDADLVVLSDNLLTITEENILKTQVLMTMVRGKIYYQHPRLIF